MENLKDLVECPICMEVMQDPRMLPCVHTYCSTCLEKLKDFQPGSKLLCPVCRIEFTVPQDGVKSIPKNFFIPKICAAQISPEGTENINVCEICDPPDSNSHAISYCHDCEQKFCRRCGIAHTKIKVAEHHKMTDLSTAKLPFFRKKSEICPQHRNRSLDVYCKSCKSMICIVCLTESHKPHDIADVKNLSLSFQDQLKNNITALKVKQSDCNLKLKKLTDHENEYKLETDKIASKITGKGVEIKKVIDDAVMALLRKLDYLKKKETNRISAAVAELEEQSNILLSFIKYIEELIDLGSDPDIIEGFDLLNNRANDLKDGNILNDDFKETFPNYKYCNSYTAARQYVDHALGDVSETEIRDDPQRKIGCTICDDLVESNHVADVEQEADNLDLSKLSIKPHRSKAFTSSPVGMAIAGKIIYLIFCNCQNVESFDSDTMEFLRSITVLELLNPCDVAIVDCNWLFISDSNTVHCLDLTNGECTRWQSGFENINGLTPMLNGNILVLSRQWNKLVEYNRIGAKIREVVLPADTRYVHNTLDIGNQRYLLFHGYRKVYRLSIVNSDGQITKSFGGTTEFSLNPKSHVAILGCRNSDCYLVYDEERRSYFILDYKLDYVREVPCVGQECSVFKLTVDERKRVYLLDQAVNKLLVMKMHCEN